MKIEAILQFESKDGEQSAFEVENLKKLRDTINLVHSWADNDTIQPNRNNTDWGYLNRLVTKGSDHTVSSLSGALDAISRTIRKLSKACKDLPETSTFLEEFKSYKVALAECRDYLSPILGMLADADNDAIERHQDYARQHDRESIGLEP